GSVAAPKTAPPTAPMAAPVPTLPPVAPAITAPAPAPRIPPETARSPGFVPQAASVTAPASAKPVVIIFNDALIDIFLLPTLSRLGLACPIRVGQKTEAGSICSGAKRWLDCVSVSRCRDRSRRKTSIHFFPD